MNILIADDDPMQRELLAGFLAKQGYRVLAAADGEEALTLFRRESIQLALLDHRMPGLTGDQVLERIKASNPLTRAILITAYGAVETAVNVMKLGADDFIEKPVDLTDLLARIHRVEQSLAVAADVAEVVDAVEAGPLPLAIIGDSPAMRDTLSLVRRVADSPWSVLIQGETGTGKELIARLVHLLGPTPAAPFIEVNCAAIPENLFESELFGHEKGAFTGADRQHRGCFERAAGGTLFLDEVGELPPALQSKLLRALQEKRISRIGSERDIAVEARVIAATNRDLRALSESGGFREDLFFRLNVLDIPVPPLRRRREDIPALVAHFVARDARRPIRIAPQTLDLLVRYDYPGNVRELEHILQRSLTLARGSLLQPADLPEEVRHGTTLAQGLLQERLDILERDLLTAALEETDWIQTRAAERLGVSERVLRYKMGKYALRRRSV
ncbi:sigma-54-dependent transcriptional regulator [Thiocystis violascens]|uniref:Response regulator with CheY-like receiver, AAA-type ATPase, and DNA-binding domains n=1 Tax=Thiocystis violascens (strain ATCC 17096 / DSM 198 / 6111) TaxID=765911 RepID=I3YFL5_THIV6|nr:sigma-54 dependent transcriptional regulator [Thiocystis violascens]AFL75783.1 response regulator with CheY-like receiver, AAA-type ATPase, and DNA-binding domains [Thiocystis violascens DSM 198]